MAKLNWQRIAWDSARNESNLERVETAQRLSDRQMYFKNNLMPRGKYAGHPLSRIPLKYLVWASENLGKQDQIKILADKELRHRYGKLSDT